MAGCPATISHRKHSYAEGITGTLQKSNQKLDPREEHYWVASPPNGMQLFVRHLAPERTQRSEVRPILYVMARDLLAFCSSIVVPMKPFLAKKGHPPEVVNRMYDAW
jgi:hypothetical protein